MSEVGMDAPTRQARWVEKTENIDRLIHECAEHLSNIRNAAGFILKQAPPLNTSEDEAAKELAMAQEELVKLSSGHGTPSDSALSLRLDQISNSLSRHNQELSEVYELIDR
jgi:hypothetical protein